MPSSGLVAAYNQKSRTVAESQPFAMSRKQLIIS